MPPQPRSLGIRLIDVGVVVGMFVVLAALSMPIILRVREAANKMICASNLRQIAIASHNYHNDHNHLPPGWLGPNPNGPDPSKSPNVGVLVELVPYMESDNFYRLLYYQRDLKARTDGSSQLVPPADVPWWKLTHPDTGVSNLQVARTRFKPFECPSVYDRRERIGAILAIHIYAPEAPESFLKQTMLTYADRPDLGELARSNYLGVAGCIGRLDQDKVITGTAVPACAAYEGIFGNRSDLTLGQLTVQDGTSNTIMFGETCGGSARDGGGVYTFSWFAGAMPTYYGLPRGRNLPWYCFSSRHKGVVQFTFADGSTRGIRRGRTVELYGEDWFLLQSLAGRKDGSLGWD